MTHLSLFSGIGRKERRMRVVSEETRRKMSEAAMRRCTPEWRKAKSDAYSTPLDFDAVKGMYESGMTQDEIAEHLETTQKVVWRFMKKHGIKARTAAKRDQYGPNNSSWKGDSACYSAFHSRVYTQRGPAKFHGCAICGATTESTSYDWANLTGDYGNPDDYAPMCRSCHRQFDARKKVVECPD